MNPIKRLTARLLPGRFPSQSTPAPHGETGPLGGSPVGEPTPRRPACRSPGRLRLWQAAALAVGLIAGGAAQAALSAKPNPSTDGSYTVSWTKVAGATKYKLFEGSTLVFEGAGLSKAFSGKSVGTRTYTLQHCLYVAFPVGQTVCVPSGFAALTVKVTKSQPAPPAKPALTVPATSHTGSYSVSWTKPKGATRFELEEKAGSAAWKGAYSGGAASKAFANKGAGTYGYRVRACAGAANCGGWSATGSVRVTRAAATLMAKPNPAPGGNYKVSWTTTVAGTSHRLHERFNKGAATTYAVVGRSKAFANKPPGSYAYSLDVCLRVLGQTTCLATGSSVTVTVPAPAPTGTISASPSPCAIPKGATRCSTTVTWSTRNATKPCVYLKSSKGKFACAASGSKAAPWITAAGRTLELKNGGTYAAETLASVFVKGVPAPAPTVSASFDASEVKLGGSVDLTWSSTNAASCSGSRSLGSTKPSGTAAFTPGAVGDFAVKVTCTGAGGSGSATATAKVVDVPDAPGKPEATPSGSTKLTVSWTAPSSNGAAITGYGVRHRLNGNMADWSDPISAGTRTAKTLTGLAADTAYQVQVRAKNRLGAGEWSKPADARTGKAPTKVPAVPASLTVPASDADGSYEVSWNASAGAVRYELQERIGTGAWAGAYKGAATSAELKGRRIATYGYQVRACATAAASSCSGWSAERKAAVSGALAAEPNPSPNGSYTVSWTPALAAQRYRLRESADGGANWSTSGRLTATQQAFSGKADGTYLYQVQGCIDVGSPVGWVCTPLIQSQQAATLTVTVARSLAPPTLTVAPNPAPAGAYRVSWTASRNAAGYVLQERANGGDWSNVTGVTGRAKNFTKKSAAVYGYQVKACDSDDDCGAFSATATVRVPPAAPTVSTGACRNGKYELSWTKAADAATTVLEQRKGMGDWSEAYSGAATKTPLALTAGASHSFRAKACAAAANCSAWGTTLALTAPDCSGPDVPANLRREATGPDGYRVLWDAVSGSGIRYELEQKHGSGDWTNVHDGTGRTKSFSGQSAGAYRYRVRSRSASNVRSAYTAELSLTVPIPPPAPTNLTVSAPNANRDFKVSWKAVSWGSAKVSYRLEEARGPQTGEEPVAGTSKAFAGKAPGTYAYRVKACAPASNCGGFSAAASVTVPPDAPTLSPLACDGGSHRLSWSKVTGATGYRLEQRQGQGKWESAYSGGKISTALKLTVGAEYGFRAKACAADANCGAFSATATATAPDCAAAGVPGGLAVTPTGPNSYKVAWNAVSGTVRAYQLQERVGAGSWQTVHDGTGRERTFTGKSNGAYAYQVRACPQAGDCSAYSAAQSVTVPVPPPAPTGLAATAPNSNGDYTVTWNEVAWGGAVTYRLEEQPAGGAWAQVHDGAANSLAVAGKAAGRYAYRARACAAGACGGWSGPLSLNVARPAATVVEAPPAPHAAKPSLVSDAEIKATDAAGTLAGAFRVTESGAASYRIPIYATPGTAGTAPELALAYNSQAGNGIAGLGWTLEGGSAVTRCRATRHQDGAAKPIQWNAQDRFCLDGQRLVLASGTYGSPGSAYRTEIDSFAAVKAVGGTAGHPDHFEVRRKDGSVAHYGNVPGSAHKDAKRTNGKGQTLTWALKRFADSVGNPVLYLYAGGADSHRLAEVRYAYGAERGTGDHHAAVKFVYADRADGTAGYVAGHKFTNGKRLAKVQTLSHDGKALKAVRELRLAYGTMAGNKTSLLTSATECAGEDVTVNGKAVPATCKTPTKFTWPANAVGFKAASGSAKLTPRKDRGLLSHHPADVNGDGMMDLVWVEWDVDGSDTDHHLKYALSDGAMLKPAPFANGAASVEHMEDVGRSWANVLARPIDYNGDGRTDVALWRARDPVWRVHLSVPTAAGGWRLDAAAVATPVTHRLAEFTDLNGDGLADAVYSRGATVLARHLERDATQPDASGTPYKFGAEATLLTVPSTGPVGRLSPTASTGIQAGGHDFNGDGRADFIARTRFEANLGQLGRVSQTVHGPYAAGPDGAWRRLASFGEDRLHAADFNGDGLTDLVREVRAGGKLYPYLEVNTGAGFESHYSTLSLEAGDVRILPPADHNGDGHPDLVWHDRKAQAVRALSFDPATGRLATSLGGGIATLARGAGRKDAHLLLDADGDGAVDYLRLSDLNGKGKLETFPSNNAGRFPRQVSRITNGLGAATAVTHESLARTDHYERLDVRRTVAPAQFCFSFAGGSACVPYANPIDGDLKTVDKDGNPLTPAQVAANAKALLAKRTKAFYTALNQGWRLPAGAQALGRHGPVLEFRAPVPVVVRVEGTAPAAGAAPGSVATAATSAVEHFYADAKVQAMGRGPLGFGQLKTRDVQTGVETTTRYRHDFPFTGMPVSTVAALPVKSGSGTTLRRLSESATTWKLTGYQSAWAATAKASGTAALGALRPYAAQTVEKAYDLNGGTDAKPSLLTTVTTELEQDDHGNATKVTVTTEGDGRVFKAETANTYGPSEADKRLGRLTATTVTHARRKASQSANQALKAVRKSAFAYYGQSACPASNSVHAGLLCREVVEPGHERLKVTTTHAYDRFGNRVRSKVDYFDDVPVPGQAAPTGSARIRTRCDADAAAYGPKGRFVKARFDCLGRKASEVAARDAHGSPTKVKRFLDKAGAKSVTDEITYTPGGAEVLSASATGAYAVATRAMGAPKGKDAASCPAGTALHERIRRGGGGESVTCHDALAREVRAATLGFGGKWIHVDTEYDRLGRVRRVSEPHHAGERRCAKDQGDSRCWTVTDYDILGRIVKVTGPDGSATTFAHGGFTTATTNALGQKAKEKRNALGETASTEDHHGGKVEFVRDAQGNVVRTTRRKPSSDATPAPASVATTAAFDLLGRMTAQDDPDLGRIQYRYNSLGEPRCRQDAAGSLTVTAHDGLGRVASRKDFRARAGSACGTLSATPGALEGDASWTYDAGTGLGQLASEADAVSGFSRTQSYDSLGRPSTAATVPGTGADTHHEKATYDQFGRPFQFFDASRTAARFDFNGARHAYNANGYLERLQDAEGTLDGQGTFVTRTVYRAVTAMDARGNVTAETLGNGVKRTHAFDGRTGRLLGIQAGKSSAKDLQSLAYEWDALGNLQSHTRGEGASALAEAFAYDGLNRLRTHRVGAGAVQSTAYDGYGNVRSRTGVGTYAYGADSGASGRPHAVASVTKGQSTVTHAYNANGSLTSSSDGRTVSYAAFGKATSIAKGDRTSSFAHGPDRARFKRVDTDGDGNKTTTLYVGSVERVTYPDGTATVRRRIGGVAIELDGPAKGSCEADAVRYVLRDHLGSVDRLTDAQGTEAQAMSFAAWGARRDPSDWTELAEAAAASFDGCATRRGFTGHEMLDAVGIVHMNGRIYDPALGRFLRADPFVQFPANLQSHNRYSYALNNPLAYTDPSGHFLKGLLRPLASIAISVWLPGAGIWTGTGLFAANGIGAVAASGFIAGAVGSGSLKGAVVGAFSAAAFNGLGGVPFGGGLGGVAVRSATYGFVGGVMGVLQGGRFGHGFLSAAGAQALSGPIGRLGNRFQRTAAAAAVGGTLSAATGGKFANGAVTAAFASAFAEREATVSSTEGDDEQANRSAFQKRLNELKRDGTLDPSQDFNTPDDAAKHVLNATAPLSAEYGLEVAGSIYETREGLFRYTFPEIGEATHAFLTMKYRGYHTHPSGELMFSNAFRNSQSTDGHDYNWVRTARKDLYLGVVGNGGAVRIGVCEYRRCSGSGRLGTDPSRVLQ